MKTKRLLHGIFEFNCLYMYTHVYSFRSFLFMPVSKKVFLFMRAPQSKNKKFFIVRLCRNFSNRHLLILFNKTYLLHIKIYNSNLINYLFLLPISFWNGHLHLWKLNQLFTLTTYKPLERSFTPVEA